MQISNFKFLSSIIICCFFERNFSNLNVQHMLSTTTVMSTISTLFVSYFVIAFVNGTNQPTDIIFL